MVQQQQPKNRTAITTTKIQFEAIFFVRFKIPLTLRLCMLFKVCLVDNQYYCSHLVLYIHMQVLILSSLPILGYKIIETLCRIYGNKQSSVWIVWVQKREANHFWFEHAHDQEFTLLISLDIMQSQVKYQWHGLIHDTLTLFGVKPHKWHDWETDE